MESHSVQILLPPDLVAATRKVVEGLGSTWSPWGGHITLISRFTTTLDVIALKDVLTDACTNIAPFPLKLDNIAAEENRNGHGGHFVMITTKKIPVPLLDLRRRLFDSLKSQIVFVYPDIAESPFQPHVSLSLELPIVEALSLKHRLKNNNVILQLTVTSISLITFNESAFKNLRISLYTGRK